MNPQRTRGSLHELCQVRPDDATPAHAKNTLRSACAAPRSGSTVTAAVCIDSDQILGHLAQPEPGVPSRDSGSLPGRCCPCSRRSQPSHPCRSRRTATNRYGPQLIQAVLHVLPRVLVNRNVALLRVGESNRFAMLVRRTPPASACALYLWTCSWCASRSRFRFFAVL